MVESAQSNPDTANPTHHWRQRLSVRRRLLDLANRLLAPADVILERRSSLDLPLEWLAPRPPSERERAARPAPDNARLAELRERYRRFSGAATHHSAWTDAHVAEAVDLTSFRAESGFVWQKRFLGRPNLTYVLTTLYALSIDRLGLFEALHEDGAFGAHVFRFRNQKLVGRDLLDSVIEIHALDEFFDLAAGGKRVLDIGAGYGRLGHRLAEGLPSLESIYCSDAVAEATFLCERYLSFRGVSDRAKAVALDEIEGRLAAERVDVATNIHSFSECTLEAIGWWLDLLREHAVPYLFIVPNTDRLLVSSETDGSRRDFEPEILRRGYRRAACVPKYRDPALQEQGLFPTHHHVFELGSGHT